MSTTKQSQRQAGSRVDEPTLERLIRAGRKRFAEEGFSATSLDAIVADAGVTKGSLYHHFTSKADLFSDVYEDELAMLTRRIAEAYASKDDVREAARAGLTEFLDSHMDPGVQRITLVDAPSALGWERMRELRAPYGPALLEQVLRKLAETGALRYRDIEALAHLLFGALCEAAMHIVSAEDPPAERRKMERELRVLLDSLAPPT